MTQIQITANWYNIPPEQQNSVTIDVAKIKKIYIQSSEDNIPKPVGIVLYDNLDNSEIETNPNLKCVYNKYTQVVFLIVPDGEVDVTVTGNAFAACTNIVAIDGLERCTVSSDFTFSSSLQEINIADNSNLNESLDLTKLKSLKRVRATNLDLTNTDSPLKCYKDGTWTSNGDGGTYTFIDPTQTKDIYITRKQTDMLANEVRQRTSSAKWFTIKELIDTLSTSK